METWQDRTEEPLFALPSLSPSRLFRPCPCPSPFPFSGSLPRAPTPSDAPHLIIQHLLFFKTYSLSTVVLAGVSLKMVVISRSPSN